MARKRSAASGLFRDGLHPLRSVMTVDKKTSLGKNFMSVITHSEARAQSGDITAAAEVLGSGNSARPAFEGSEGQKLFPDVVSALFHGNSIRVFCRMSSAHGPSVNACPRSLLEVCINAVTSGKAA